MLSACAPAQPAAEEQTEAPASDATQEQAEQPTEPAEAQPEETEVPTEEPTAVPEEPIHITTNQSQLTSYGPLFIADAEGYFTEQNIELEWVTFNRSSDGLPLIVTGDLDVYSSSVNSGLLNVLGQTDDVRVVADRGFIDPNGCTYYGIMIRKDLLDSGEVAGPEDLAGRVIAGQTVGQTAYLISQYLEPAGLTFDDVEISDVPPAGFVDALNNGVIDGFVAPELWITRAKSADAAGLLVGAEDVVPGLQLSVLVFGKRLLVDEPEAGVRFLTAYMKGVRQYNEGKTPRNLEIMAEYTGLTTEELETSCWPPINPEGAVNFAATDAMQVWAVARGDQDGLVTEEQFWDPSVLDAALERLDQ